MPNKQTYILFSESGNRILVNPKPIPKDAIPIDVASLPRGVSPSYLKLDKKSNKIVPMNRWEKRSLELKANPIKQKVIKSYRNEALCFVVGLILGAIGVWQLFNY